MLVRGLLEGKGGAEAIVVIQVHIELAAFASLAAGIGVKQFGGHVMDFFRGFLASLGPLLGAQAVQWRGVAAPVTADQMQGGDRHIEFVAASVFQ